MRFKHSASVMALALLITPLAACGGDDSSSSSGGDNPAFEENVDSKGPITYVQGKDNTGVVAVLIDKWNKEHPDEKVTVKEQTDEANQQHDDLVRNLDAQNADYDVMSVDLVWTAEFAAKGYLQPLEGDLAIKTEGVLQPVIDSGNYNGTQYAAPQTSDGGMLYYRTDLVKTPPKSWDEMMGMCDIAKQEQDRLLRRPVRQVRRPHRERLRVDQRCRRPDRGRRRQGDRGQPRVRQGPRQPGPGVRRRQHPEGRDHLHRGGEPDLLPERQAPLHAPVALRLQPGARPRAARRSRASSPSPRWSAWTVPVPPRSVATTTPSAPTPTTRRPRSPS